MERLHILLVIKTNIRQATNGLDSCRIAPAGLPDSAERCAFSVWQGRPTTGGVPKVVPTRFLLVWQQAGVGTNKMSKPVLVLQLPSLGTTCSTCFYAILSFRTSNNLWAPCLVTTCVGVAVGFSCRSGTTCFMSLAPAFLWAPHASCPSAALSDCAYKHVPVVFTPLNIFKHLLEKKANGASILNICLYIYIYICIY